MIKQLICLNIEDRRKKTRHFVRDESSQVVATHFATMSLDTRTCVINYKYPGVEILKNIQSEFCDKIYENLGPSYSRKLTCIICNCREYRSPKYICVKKPLKLSMIEGMDRGPTILQFCSISPN